MPKHATAAARAHERQECRTRYCCWCRPALGPGDPGDDGALLLCTKAPPLVKLALACEALPPSTLAAEPFTTLVCARSRACESWPGPACTSAAGGGRPEACEPDLVLLPSLAGIRKESNCAGRRAAGDGPDTVAGR